VYDQLDPRLQLLVTRIRDEVCDISLVSGYRDFMEQNALFEAQQAAIARGGLATIPYADL
jgi:hypothetical protein